MKVFLSHNMSGLTEEQVMKIRKDAEESIKEFYGPLEPNIEIIDNYTHPEAPKNAPSLWHLGRSIQQMAEADVVYFASESYHRGCQVEELICELYGIKVLKI